MHERLPKQLRGEEVGGKLMPSFFIGGRVATEQAFFDEGRTQAYRFIGTIMDITEAKPLQEGIQQVYDDLEV